MSTKSSEGTVTQINRKLREKKEAEKGNGKDGALVQGELIEDARQPAELPEKLRNLLAPLCAAEETAGASRLRATELLGEIQKFMAELNIPEVKLPNGGLVIYTEKKSARYVAPKKSKTVDAGDADDGDTDADEE